ncbi:GDSL lipase/acylhydrolase family protein [Sistotremastrum niveocremeum HHB9708]|uniref:GDSL lipase/acylhydrolase family protein n=2 Tax=Sistotremastraceae TaxID=3402574 RepID=A0A164NDR3_9AGAM|nr:GDSL lipase/acylhydrolase family protein [Sistotremastrum niveocremeum HHB9708]KZT34515.1 GDSL lipase/acylhydrolase family protein [Sistotremastrum suecicum HHB10207 ss-3]
MVVLSALPLLLAIPATVSAWTIKNLVTFGDSYTDQSRLGYWYANSTAPPPHYSELYPPLGFAANGGANWVRYAELYGKLKAYNYAVSGAACSNLLTGRPGVGPPAYKDGDFPSIKEYEIGAFATDHISKVKGKSSNDLPADDTVYSVWIGTNDVGFGSLLTGNQTAGVTIVNVTECVIDWMESIYAYGGRNFVFQNMIPLQLTPLYSVNPGPLTRYWPYAHNRTQYAIEISELVAAGNALWNLQVPAALSKLPGAKAAIFDSHQLFTDMYYSPSKYLNGSKPLNVTGYVAVSNITGGDTVVAKNPDSFLWYDALHPSEQASRIVAQEIVKTVQGTSKYATYFNGKF